MISRFGGIIICAIVSGLATAGILEWFGVHRNISEVIGSTIAGFLLLWLCIEASRRPDGTVPPPSCFGSKPGPQDRAERDCGHCPHDDQCHRASYNKVSEQ